LANTDYRFINELAEAQNQLLRDLEDEFRHKFIALVDAHMKEASDLLRRVKNTDVKLSEAHMVDLKAELDLERTQIERRYFEKLKELNERRQELKVKQRQQQAEVNELDREVAVMEAEQKHLAEIENKRQDMLQKQQQMVSEMTRRGISKEEMDALIEQHAQEVSAWEAAMEAERRRQRDMVQAKLAKREERYKQRLQDRIALYKEENLALMKRQEEEDGRKLKIVKSISHEPVLYCPMEDIASLLRVTTTPAVEVDEGLLKLILKKVKAVEKVVRNVDTTQFEELLNAAEELDHLIHSVRVKLS
jgi:chromosome segregation ATPase